MYVRVCEYRPVAGRQAEFERFHGPGGPRARLLTGAEGYLGTRLERCIDRDRYRTVELWRQELDHATHRSAHPADHARIAEQSASLSAETRFVTAFHGDPDDVESPEWERVR